jgi:lactate permease
LPWSQVYDPLNSPALSTLLASVPLIALLGTLGFLRFRAHNAALIGLAASLIVATVVFRMPAKMAFAAAAYGAAYGFLPIGWIVLNVIFLYQMTKEKGLFDILRISITGLTEDRRLQLLLVAFSFGAFFEGAAGFGAPVAVTSQILIGLGFSPLAASSLSLIANTAPVAYGALGTPIIGLQSVTGLGLKELSAMVGRQLPFFSLIVPFWLVCAFAGFRASLQVWPAILAAGICFALPQFLISNLHGPWLVDIISSIFSMVAVAICLKLWRPKRIWKLAGEEYKSATQPTNNYTCNQLRAWLPWIILSAIVFLWGLPQVKASLDGISAVKLPVPGLDRQVMRMPPIVPEPTPEGAVYNLNWLSATGTGILLSAIIAGFVMRYNLAGMVRLYWDTIKLVRFSLLTISAMLAIGFTTRYAGLDATMGLAFAKTGSLYPFFGTLLGWLGVALTGSDTASNVLFGSLQKITATQLGLSPTLMGAANSSGGVMGKMIDAQSIVVASTATRWYGHEGDILRRVFFHSLVLACLVGLLVLLQAYVFTFMVVR